MIRFLLGVLPAIIITVIAFCINPILGVIILAFFLVVPGLTVFLANKKNKKK